MSDRVSRETPPAPESAAGVFATHLPSAERYAELLAGAAAERGLIGPREVPRLWDRHVLNCAVLTDLVGPGLTVCDVGSGAGLPGLPMAIRRPDLDVTLVEPLLRRSVFLQESVEALGLTNVEVVRARAEALHGHRAFDVVTSRAVAALDVLLRWSLPLVAPGGVVLAMKGSSAQQELLNTSEQLAAMGAARAEIVVIEAVDPVFFPTTVVRVEAATSGPLTLRPAPRTARKPSGRRPKKRR